MIGCAREDISILTSAVAYLQREERQASARGSWRKLPN
jgi:hypothetical protein